MIQILKRLQKIPRLTSGANATVANITLHKVSCIGTLYFYLAEGVGKSGGGSAFRALSRGYVHWASGQMEKLEINVQNPMFCHVRCTLKCDQYRWLHGGTYPIKFGDIRITKKSNSIDLEENGSKTGDPRFRRFEYWGVRTHYVLHYLGDNIIFKGFKHKNSKISTKPFIRSAPHVKDKV